MSRYAETALVRGLNYLAETQAAISHNLANVDTASFKRRAPQAVLAGESFDTMLGARLPMIRYAENTDFSVGNTHDTGNRFDIALAENTWLRVQDPKGRTYLTRDGRMQLDNAGYLVTANGLRYLDQTGNPIQLADAEGAPSEMTIAANGQIADPQSGRVWGPIGVFKVPNQNALLPQGSGLFVDTAAQRLELQPSGLQQGYQEGSNVDSLQELVQMILVQHNFAATQRALGSVGRMQDRLIETINR